MDSVNCCYDPSSTLVTLFKSESKLNKIPTPVVKIIDHYVGPVIRSDSDPFLLAREIQFYSSKVVTVAEDVEDKNSILNILNKIAMILRSALPNFLNEELSKVENIIVPDNCRLQKHFCLYASMIFPNVKFYRNSTQILISYSENSFYQGEFTGIDDKRQGKGCMDFSNGDSYEGDWENDLQEGQGNLRYSNRNEYSGMWKEGRKHGHGIMFYEDGAVYEGNWDNDRRHGRGSMVYHDGMKYSGMWENDKRHGIGNLTCINRKIYPAEWLYGMIQNGFAVTFENDGKYEGMWKDDMKHGMGTMTYPNGEKYVGHWENDRRHGIGIMNFWNGEKYKGYWENDRKNGFGVATWLDGSMDDGFWKNDERV